MFVIVLCLLYSVLDRFLVDRYVFLTYMPSPSACLTQLSTSKYAPILLALTPNGEVYDGPSGNMTPDDSTKGQNMDKSKNEDEYINHPKHAEEEVEKYAPIYHGEEEEANGWLLQTIWHW